MKSRSHTTGILSARTGPASILLVFLAAVLGLAATRGCTSETRVPFRLDHGLIIVEASIDDRQPDEFILDTGCGPEVMLSLAAARELGILTGDEPNLGAKVGAAQYVTRSRKSISRFRFGDSVRAVTKPAVIDLGFVERQTGLKVAGLIGQKLLDDYLVTIDYPSREIILRCGKDASVFRQELDRGSAAGVNLVRRGTGRILVEAELGDSEGYYLLDTGSARGILYEPAVTALKKAIPLSKPAPARSVQTAFERAEVQEAMIPKFRIGEVEFVNQQFALHKAPVLVNTLLQETGLQLWGTIGCQLLCEFEVTIDSERSKLYLVAPNPS